ncbi:MAG: SDR family NAD(P)-dependent oxidoreductase, partial [Gammaproteobacteria bacterium]
MKSILITGCSSGIGLAAARGLKARGYRVFPTARREEDLQKLRGEGFEALPLDLDDSASIRQAVEDLGALTGGRLDALFNNAGFGQWGAVEDLSRETLRAQFETNLFGLVELTNLILPWMRAQGAGRIVQNSSVLGLIAFPYRGAYVASKFALEGLSDALRLELRGTGIHVSLIEPGPVRTKFRENAYRAFVRNIDRENSPHRGFYQILERRLQSKAPKSRFTQPPEAILKPLLHALESPRPRA